MSFFKKLKEGLFKSSSKIDEGLKKIKEDQSKHTDNKNEDQPITESVDLFLKSKVESNKKINEDKKNFFKRFIPTNKKENNIRVNKSTLELLEETLITTDMGIETSTKIIKSLSKKVLGKKINFEEIKLLLADEILKIFDNSHNMLSLIDNDLNVFLVVGVNGSGKTTTIGKLAKLYKDQDKKVLIAAGDTFRAAAVEQLEIWGNNSNTDVFKLKEGSDPASLSYDAISKELKKKIDLLMIDTAGRLQNRNDLMQELSKIVRVIKKKNLNVPLKTILVLDASTGQNALSQVELFKSMADVSGIVMTKLDGSAKGGILVALTDKFSLPIYAVGVGEKIDDLNAFSKHDYVEALLNLKERN